VQVIRRYAVIAVEKHPHRFLSVVHFLPELMMAIPKRVDERIVKGCQKIRPVLMEARDRDVNEADTVTIVKSVLSDVFGWNPFFEVTSEYAIRSTYVDLAVRTEGQLRYLIEVKAIGGDLKENHLRQAVNYAANQGVDWVVLTNGAIWQAHRVNFGKPISHELVFQLDLINDNVKQARFRELAFLLSKEGMTKAAIADYHAEKQALSKFNLAAIVRSQPVLQVIRRELKRAYPKFNPPLEQIEEQLLTEVLKRDVVDGDRALAAVKSIRRVQRPLRSTKATGVEDASPQGSAASGT